MVISIFFPYTTERRAMRMRISIVMFSVLVPRTNGQTPVVEEHKEWPLTNNGYWKDKKIKWPNCIVFMYLYLLACPTGESTHYQVK